MSDFTELLKSMTSDQRRAFLRMEKDISNLWSEVAGLRLAQNGWATTEKELRAEGIVLRDAISKFQEAFDAARIMSKHSVKAFAEAKAFEFLGRELLNELKTRVEVLEGRIAPASARMYCAVCGFPEFDPWGAPTHIMMGGEWICSISFIKEDGGVRNFDGHPFTRKVNP